MCMKEELSMTTKTKWILPSVLLCGLFLSSDAHAKEKEMKIDTFNGPKPRISTPLNLGNEAKKNQMIKNANTMSVINLGDGMPYNFFAYWKPKDKNADGIPSNMKIINNGSGLRTVNGSNGKPKVNTGQTGYEAITFQGFKGSSGGKFSAGYKAGVRYLDVGRFNGKSVDMEVTFDGAYLYANKENQRCVSFGVNSISLATGGISDLGLRYRFLESGTDTPINLSKTGWILTFSDVDALQGVRVYGGSYNGNNMPKAFIARPTSVLNYGNEKDVFEIRDTKGGDRDDPDDAFSALFNHDSSKTFHWLKDYSKWDKDANDFTLGKTKSDIIGQEYLGYSGIKPALSMLSSPSKAVGDKNEPLDRLNNTWNTLTKPDETFTYQISHVVPRESKRYKDYKIEDVVDSRLEVIPGSIHAYYRNSSGTLSQVDNMFKLSVTKSGASDKVVAEGTSNLLRGPIYDKEIVIQFDVRSKEKTDQATRYNNVAHVYAHAEDGKPLWLSASESANGKPTNETNETRTDSPAPDKPIPPKPDPEPEPTPTEGKVEKYVWNGHSWTKDNVTGLKVGDTVKYKVDYKIPENFHFGKVHLWDDLDNRLDIMNATVKMDGRDISNYNATLTIDDSEEKVDWKSGKNYVDGRDYEGKTLTLEVDAKVKNGATSSVRVPNTSSYELLGGSESYRRNSNTVYIETVASKKASIRKYVLKNGVKVSDLRNVHCGDDVRYELDVTFPEGKNYQNMRIVDNLDDRIDLKSVRILSGGRDVTSQGFLDMDNQEEYFSWKPDRMSDFYGKDVTVQIDGKLKYRYDVSNGVKIPNEARVDFDLEHVTSNEVGVYPSVIDATAEKFISK